jgi:broad specificity phosphatase PhoE|mmetsp:Transcript_11699/g.28405  ORF Transcript_11699/g.28405 Transcript_11699/m.28405 type:complete len:85 (+) Transcript_11699:69-323(+)
MLGLLAKDDTGLEPGGEEPDAAVMERVRAWLAAVFDEVDEHVVIAVTHSDWITHAMLEVGLGTFNWFEPRNNELIPIIIEDVRV